MKETYEFWNNVKEIATNAIKNSEEEITINKAMVEVATNRLKNFKKPVEPNNPIVK